MISYAQNFEDIILHRALRDVSEGFYIDIGAQSPDIDSVSRMFYEHGWRGVHCEPSPQYARQLRNARPDEQVIESAIGDTDENLTFFVIRDSGLSTSNAEFIRQHEANGYAYEEVNVRSIPTHQLLDSIGTETVHWMKIDVEGMEESVLRGWQPSKVRPWIVVIESTIPNSQIENYQDWEPSILELGYEFAYFDGLNRFYVHNSQSERLKVFGPGPNVFDGISLSHESTSPIMTLANEEKKALEEAVQSKSEHLERTEILKATILGENIELKEVNEALQESNNNLKKDKAALNESNKGLKEANKILNESNKEFQKSKETLADQLKESSALHEREMREQFDRYEAVNRTLIERDIQIEAERTRNDDLRAYTNFAESALEEIKSREERQRQLMEEKEMTLLAQMGRLNADHLESLAYIEELTAEIQKHAEAMSEIRKTASWRITKPIRLISSIVRSPFRGAKGILRRMAEYVYFLGQRRPQVRSTYTFIASLIPPLKRRVDLFESLRATEMVYVKSSPSPEASHSSENITQGKSKLHYPGSARIFSDISS